MNHFNDFKARMKAQPWLFRIVEKTAIQFLEGGYSGMSMDYILNSIRWAPNIPKVGIPQGEEFALNNNHRSYLTRLFLHVHPKYRDRFDLRIAKGADMITPSEWDEILEGIRPKRIPEKQLSIYDLPYPTKSNQ